MNDIFPSTAFTTGQREAEDAAGITREHEDAAYNTCLEYVLQRGREDFSSGNYISGIDALKSAIA